MRKKFRFQYEIGITSIENIDIPITRHELHPVLRSLQHIYSEKVLFDKILTILSTKIKIQKKGRPGLSLWEILVLAVIRLTLGIDYDWLSDQANNHDLIRGILGAHRFGGAGKKYPRQTIVDNISHLDNSLIDDINKLIVEEGHRLTKTSDSQALEVKVDSYPVESNVHFPTDINLLWDSGRVSLGQIIQILGVTQVEGWRKVDYLMRRLKKLFINLNKIAFKGGKNKEERVVNATIEYLSLAIKISERIKETRPELHRVASGSIMANFALNKLDYFEEMLDKHIDLVHRRIIKNEKIPHDEKLFSIFETYTRWINKGKSGNRIELGLPVTICTDQFGFIVYHQIMETEQDVDVAITVTNYLTEHYLIKSISFDKGYWSKINYKAISEKVEHTIMPKKGKLNKEENAREHSLDFVIRRKRHSAIESNINGLEHHGLNRCPDKGLKNFRRYVSLGVLSYNLHKLGDVLQANDKKKEKESYLIAS